MANEAVCIEAPKKIVNRNCIDGAAIAKGTLCKLSGTNFVSAATGSGEPFGGITIEEKTISDSITNIACAMDGVWDILGCPSPLNTTGTQVCMSGANMIRNCAAADLLTGACMGTLEESGLTSTVQRVRLLA
jgi:hypothetical protein